MEIDDAYRFLHVLMIHNRYQYAGGEDSSTLTEIDLLLQFGHHVKLIERHNDEIKTYSLRKKINLFFRTAWNSQTDKNLWASLKKGHPDLLHVQNFFPLFSPSVHAVAQSLNIPTIQHLHNFRLGCLNASLFRENQICEVCVGKNPWRGILYRCYRNSLPASLGVWNMLAYNRYRKTWHKDVSAFITPSQFAANKLIEIGIPGDRLHVKPNITVDPLIGGVIPPLPERPTFLFIGRLSSEKGLDMLLQAWEKLNEPEWKLNIVGEGPQRQELQEFVNERNLKNVSFFGQQSKDQVVEHIKNATAIVVPSQWYETFGRVVIEAFACGRPVIAADLGALSELVENNTTGFLVAYNSIHVWAENMAWAGNNYFEMTAIGQKARQEYLRLYTPEVNYQKTIDIYQSVLK
ncbi:glycosyltransferase family 4 protein [[Limnothrix rosea] IAM M-220]|uniref:glycosyltransferase family 4 protein n=1 Tax=[Limnothrix rosea] IAM M-220 TaxID=454133 RepID=UPI0009626E98|nr:glycosyltransferase family 4 protein [[Limnothrix rosea] IAM M-220]OKH17251.1 group 1 glycosyl transferase [[Limnothrix rosea] IAM M-220]